MTILPKKKQAKEKSEASTSDHSHGHQHSHSSHTAHSPSGVEGRHDSRVTTRRPNSPPARWGSPNSREDPRLARGASHDPGGRFEDFGSHEASGHNKRRHRSSPHRNVRKHRGDPGYPSTSSHSHCHRHSNYRHERPSTSQELSVSPSIDNDNLEVDELKNLNGYNSEDEYGTPAQGPENIEQLEQWFDQALKEKRGYVIKKMCEDGACLFRAVADQVYGDQEMHDILRKNCMDYMAKNADFFRQYITEDFESYLNRKRGDSSHGNHIEIQAMCELFNRPIEVYQYSVDPINTFHNSYKTDNEPIRLSYHGEVHYNSVVDPMKATIGVGLGLPGFQPGLAEKNLMRDAVQKSEDFAIETTMLEDKLRETDWEVTQETIEEQVARESYLQWLREQEKLAKKQSSPKTASATCSSASESQALWDGTTSSKSPEPRTSRSPRSRSNNTSAQNSPNRPLDAMLQDQLPSPKPADVQQLMLPGGSMSPSSPRPSTAANDAASYSPRLEGAVGGTFPETASIMNQLPSGMYGFSEWDEDDILAQVIAQSQQEYLDNLKMKATTTSSSSSSSPLGGASPCQRFPMDFHDGPSESKNSHSNSKGSGAKNS